MHRATEQMREQLRTMNPADRSRLARETEAEMRHPHHPESDRDDSLGGYLVSDDDGDHLPTTRNGRLDHHLLGAAWAALHGGYRGNQYEGPGKEQALRKLIGLYHREGLDLPDQSEDTQGDAQ